MDNCGSTDECSVLLDGWRELGTLYVEDGATWVPECDGRFEKIPINVSSSQQRDIPYKRRDKRFKLVRRPTQGLLLELGWRMAWNSCRMHGFSTIGTVLCNDGGSRLKGVNSLKSGGDLWGPNRRSNRATYPYSEPLSNLCFLKSVVGYDP
ncbi:hypothetical protein CRG98_022021 [Punica granatum]|uniref:Uncharacterized protein n=1 Tax=Punica granatum TaxID=22663 RepID=A0A2I0JNS7_PUNGR|nr:hypothetical protein CRG98_022021 [Punica granatum]